MNVPGTPDPEDGGAGTGSFARSALLNILLVIWTMGLGIMCLPVLALPRAATWKVGRIWFGGVRTLLRRIIGLGDQIDDGDVDRTQPAIYALQHQSAWDTAVLPILLHQPAVVLKRELLWIPIYGWYLARIGMIPIDRGAGPRALRRMLRATRAALAEGRPIVIFPEGTRVRPGANAPYLPGIAALYRALDVPVVPVALNSGSFWGRRAFIKRPGTIRLRLLEPIPPGLDRAAFEKLLRDRIAAAHPLG